VIRSTGVPTAATALDSWSLESQVRRAQDAARSLRLQLNILQARTERAIDAVLATLAKRCVRALLVGNDGFSCLTRAIRFALHPKFGGCLFRPSRTRRSGGLVSYGANLSDVYRQAGI
jgi:hypothetical protein